MIIYNKKGFTLVEVLASSMILVTIVIAIVFSLTFSQDMVQSNSNKDAYAAEAQTAADAIMNYVNGGYTNVNEIQNVSRVGGEYIYIDASSGFDEAEDKVQFTLEQTEETPSFYKITVRLYYGSENDRNKVELIAYSHAEW